MPLLTIAQAVTLTSNVANNIVFKEEDGIHGLVMQATQMGMTVQHKNGWSFRTWDNEMAFIVNGNPFNIDIEDDSDIDDGLSSHNPRLYDLVGGNFR